MGIGGFGRLPLWRLHSGGDLAPRKDNLREPCSGRDEMALGRWICVEDSRNPGDQRPRGNPAVSGFSVNLADRGSSEQSPESRKGKNQPHGESGSFHRIIKIEEMSGQHDHRAASVRLEVGADVPGRRSYAPILDGRLL